MRHDLRIKIQPRIRFWGLAILVFFTLSCGKIQNSSTNDLNLYGSGITGTPEFLAARTVLSNQCMSCHSGWGSYSETDYTSKFLVILGSLQDSILYTRIRGNDTGVAGDMPTGGRPNLTAEEMKKIKKWISP